MHASFRERFVMASRREDTEAATEAVLAALERLGYDKAAVFAVRLSLEEALANAVRHGNKDDAGRRVTLHCEIGVDEAVLDVQDEGDGFDPGSVPDPTAAENLDIPSGRGLMLIRSFMADVTVHPPGNRITMRYHRA